MKYSIVFLLLAGCASPRLYKDVEVGNEAKPMMQCKILCDGPEKPYSYTENGLECQCQRPVAENSGVMKFEVINTTGQSSETVSRGVAGQLLNGKMLISTVPQAGQ